MINKDMTMVLYKDYPAHCASLPKQIKAKVVDTTEEMLKNPESPGLHIEKIGDDGIYSARVNDDYRIISKSEFIRKSERFSWWKLLRRL